MIPLSLTITSEEALQRDFTQLIPDLNRCGFSNCKIAYRLGRSEAVIRKWKAGESKPDYNDGAVIVAMHMIYCGPIVPHETSHVRAIEVEQTP